MTAHLNMPSAELAVRLLSEVAYDRRMTGVSMHCLHGPTEVDLYSFETAGRFLYMDSLEALGDPTSGASMGYIDPRALKCWLTDTLGDPELAQAVDEATRDLGNYMAMLSPMRELMARRLEQCRSVVAG